MAKITNGKNLKLGDTIYSFSCSRQDAYKLVSCKHCKKETCKECGRGNNCSWCYGSGQHQEFAGKEYVSELKEYKIIEVLETFKGKEFYTRLPSQATFSPFDGGTKISLDGCWDKYWTNKEECEKVMKNCKHQWCS